jgi:hypothetical protein
MNLKNMKIGCSTLISAAFDAKAYGKMLDEMAKNLRYASESVEGLKNQHGENGISTEHSQYHLKHLKLALEAFENGTKKVSEIVEAHGKESYWPGRNAIPAAIPKFGCFVWLQGTTLMGAAMLANGKLDSDEYEITAPQSQQFLDEVNKQLGTHFKMSQFKFAR